MWLKWEVFIKWTGAITSVRLDVELVANDLCLSPFGGEVLRILGASAQTKWLPSQRETLIALSQVWLCGLFWVCSTKLNCDAPPSCLFQAGPQGSGPLCCFSVLVSYVCHLLGCLWQTFRAGNKVVQLAKRVGLAWRCRLCLLSKVSQSRWSSCRICPGLYSNSVRTK